MKKIPALLFALIFSAGLFAKDSSQSFQTKGKSIEELPFENTTKSISWTDVYKSGGSELHIIHDGNANSTTCKIIKNGEVISTISNPENPVYSPVTKCVYYVDRITPSLHAVNIESGKEVSLVDKTLRYPPDEIYLHGTESFALNKTKDKLFYFGEIWEYDFPVKALESIDLRTMEHKKINLGSLRSDFPGYEIYDFGIIDEKNFFIKVYNFHENRTAIVAWYKITDGKPVLKDSIKFTGHYQEEYSFFQAGNKIIFDAYGMDNADFVLSTESGSIKKETFAGGMIMNTFVYDGTEYFAALDMEEQYASSYTVAIYERDTMKEVRRKTFKPLNYLWGVVAVGVQDGKILVEDVICK